MTQNGSATGSERRKRTSPGGIAPFGGRRRGGHSRPENLTLSGGHADDWSALQDQSWPELPPPYEVPAVSDSPDWSGRSEANGVPHRPTESDEAGNGGGTGQHPRLHVFWERASETKCASGRYTELLFTSTASYPTPRTLSWAGRTQELFEWLSSDERNGL